ncbi:NADH-ubiquinone oxidoreductase 20 subunit [Elsinoe australis]|uniref:NADH-ubiquinone oxidoreductase 20 subunit n=1 Tax=Elsinoe australis TaxID=40998 RepID=A0A2P7Z1Y0_9PEZI|nr:NADH-ubiquinone oxidoreductase 20 subunit [Elsinoe australis]
MSGLPYYNYDGYGKHAVDTYHYSQATGEIKDGLRDINAQIEQAFANVDLAVRTAGGKGWSQVFRVNSYHVTLDDEVAGAMVRNLKKWAPAHEPIWTAVGVNKLAFEGMEVEIEVVALDEEEGGKKS